MSLLTVWSSKTVGAGHCFEKSCISREWQIWQAVSSLVLLLKSQVFCDLFLMQSTRPRDTYKKKKIHLLHVGQQVTHSVVGIHLLSWSFGGRGQIVQVHDCCLTISSSSLNCSQHPQSIQSKGLLHCMPFYARCKIGPIVCSLFFNGWIQCRVSLLVLCSTVRSGSTLGAEPLGLR